jgi:uncharacterized protein YndB with AHSA1/START domain
VDAPLEVVLERVIPASPAAVWAVVGSDAGMQQWLGPRLFEQREGGRMLIDAVHGMNAVGHSDRWIMFGEITKHNPETELAFTWNELDVARLACWPAYTLVRITLAAEDGGTRVALRHSGFEALPDGAEQHRTYTAAWASLNDLESLERLVLDAAHPA